MGIKDHCIHWPITSFDDIADCDLREVCKKALILAADDYLAAKHEIATLKSGRAALLNSLLGWDEWVVTVATQCEDDDGLIVADLFVNAIRRGREVK